MKYKEGYSFSRQLVESDHEDHMIVDRYGLKPDRSPGRISSRSQ